MKKHKVAIFFLLLYYAWFAFVGWHMVTGADNEAEGLRITAMVVISLGISAVYVVGFMIRMFTSKEPARENFIFLWLVTLPIVIGFIAHIINM